MKENMPDTPAKPKRRLSLSSQSSSHQKSDSALPQTSGRANVTDLENEDTEATQDSATKEREDLTNHEDDFFESVLNTQQALLRCANLFNKEGIKGGVKVKFKRHLIRLTTLILNQKHRITELETEVKTIRGIYSRDPPREVDQAKEETRPTYAQVTSLRTHDNNKTQKPSTTRTKRLPPQTHKVIIENETDPTTTLATLNKIKLNVKIRNSKTLNNGKILVETANAQDAEEIVKELQKETNNESKLKVITPARRNPHIKIYNHHGKLSDEELTEKIRDNIEEKEGLITIRYRKETQDRGENIIVELAPVIWKQIEGKARLYIGWERLSYREEYRLRQCFRCTKFGHVAKHCDNEKICTICLKPGHNYNECKGRPRCGNCKYHNKTFGTNFNTDHHTILNPDCNVFQINLKKEIANINYE